jgi:hypothetical protein
MKNKQRDEKISIEMFWMLHISRSSITSHYQPLIPNYHLHLFHKIISRIHFKLEEGVIRKLIYSL